MAVLVRSEVSSPFVSGNTALLTGPITYESYLPSPPLAPEDGGYAYGDVKDVNGGVYPSRYYFQSKCQSQDRVFSVVYQLDADTVATADASRPFVAVGILISRSADNTCTVQRYGACVGFSGLRADANYVLGDNGSITTPPLPADNIEFVQQVGQAVSDSTLFVNPTGQVIRRDIEPKQPTGPVARFFVGAGKPDDNGSYTPMNTYLDRSTATVYLVPTKDGYDSQSYAGDGPPIDGVRYQPVDLFFGTDGGVYELPDGNTSEAGFTAGDDVPVSAPNQTQQTFYDLNTGDEYGRNVG